MATVKKKTAAKEQPITTIEEDLAVSAAKAQPAQVEPHYYSEQPKITAWDERTNAEKVDSINRYYAQILMKNNRNEDAFWKQSMSKEDITASIPFNGSTGRPYQSETSLILRAISQLNGYKEPIFLTMKNANLLGATLKKEYDEQGNVKQTANGKTQFVRGVKIALISNREFVPKKDANGQVVTEPRKDKDGNILLDDKGNPLMKTVKTVQYYKSPVLETATLYHISQFDNLDMSKLKSIDMEAVNNRRDYFAKTGKEPSTKIKNFGIFPNVARDLENFVKAEAKGIDYSRPRQQHLDLGLRLDMGAKKEPQFSR